MVKDDYGLEERETRFLEAHGLWHRCRRVNVTEDPYALARLHAELRAQMGAARAL